ncbi:endonuclease VII domain-containing protein [Bradyrhizobium sp. CCGUVB1N3]|uniref:endonuclease domain-containing protein n=1 Tax=Bradyrhizobium sp. CCGUVB1N3 TaxID=2949629 RepID=UPI0020B36EB1|nr:endonuclease domain-containing protein [Bradyrhizobium sp. CCGUVB1N3]MCP3471434.1 endonuclease VII domain-containing protein [Bradyrhizobium sp. CCGUVB1N3]MCP3472374.1 endonuclease VII domain-containing protein [Bradyrhizobium sp. CCGUVB1N3]
MSKSRKRNLDRQREWRRANADKVRGYDRKSYLKHKEKRLAKSARWKADNPERVQEYSTRKERCAQRTAYQRRFYAKKLGFAECVEYPPPPTDSKCAICHRESPLALDHDHETGQFRGYICRDCNLGLGKLGDSIESIRRVLQYLERSQ